MEFLFGLNATQLLLFRAHHAPFRNALQNLGAVKFRRKYVTANERIVSVSPDQCLDARCLALRLRSQQNLHFLESTLVNSLSGLGTVLQFP